MRSGVGPHMSQRIPRQVAALPAGRPTHPAPAIPTRCNVFIDLLVYGEAARRQGTFTTSQGSYKDLVNITALQACYKNSWDIYCFICMLDVVRVHVQL